MGSRRERLLQKLNPELLKTTPKLSVTTGSLIDLGCEKNTPEDGVKDLMMRFFKNQDLNDRNKNHIMQKDIEISVSSTKYDENQRICGLISEKFSFSYMSGSEIELSDIPGRKLQKLKMELQDKMSAKWEEEYKKRVSKVKKRKSGKKYGYEDEAESNEEKSSEDEDSKSNPASCTKSRNEEDDYLDVGEIEINDNLNDCNDNNEEDGDADDEEEKDNQEGEEESDDNEDVENDEHSNGTKEGFGVANVVFEKQDSTNNDGDDSGTELCSFVPPYQPGGGLLYGGSELTQSEEYLPHNLLSPSLGLSDSPNSKPFSEETPKLKDFVPSSDNENLFLKSNKLFSQTHNGSDSYDLNDAFELCSGKFPEAGESIQSCFRSQFQKNGSKVSENGETSLENSENPSDENDETSKSEDLQITSNTKKRIVLLEGSDSDDSDDSDNENQEAQDNDSSNPKVFLEDEDDNAKNEESLNYGVKKYRKSLHFSDEDETTDFEDNNTKDCEGNGVSSGNVSEDEEYDIDQRSINYDSEENEIINPREFFEKEAELSGSEWSGDEDERGLDKFDAEEGDADNLDHNQVRSELEKIHLRRILDEDAREVRLIQELLFEDGDLHSDGKRRDRKFRWKNLEAFDEKENILENDKEAGNTSEEDCAEEEQLRKLRHEKELFLMEMKNSEDDIVDENFQSLKVTTLKSSLKSCNTVKRVEGLKFTTDDANLKKNITVCNSRGSFLTRNEEFLTRLAKVTAAINDNVMGPKNSKNFVFASKSPEKVNSDNNMVCKRPMENMEVCDRQEKKIKLITSKVINAGPSILDLLV